MPKMPRSPLSDFAKVLEEENARRQSDPKNADNFRADTLSNAQRLNSDSILLLKSDRIESAIALGILSIEELGKYFIERWGTKNAARKSKFPPHSEKQAAFFLMLQSRKLVKMGDEKFNRMMAHPDKRIRRWGPYAEQMQWAKAGYYEDLRKICTYSDKELIWPSEIVDEIHNYDVKYFHKIFRKALIASRDVKSMNLAAEIYQHGLGEL